MSTFTIHEDKIRKVLGNFHASELVYLKDFNFKDSIWPLSDIKKFTVEELAFLYGFDEEMIENISYTLRVKIHLTGHFKMIEKDFVRKDKNEYIKQLQNLSFAELENMLLPSRSLFENFNEYFPTMPTFCVPGGNFFAGRIIIVLYPGIPGEYKPALMKYFLKEKMHGARIVLLPMADFVANMMYLLLKNHIVDAILCFYSRRAEQNNWYWIQNQLKDGIDSSVGSNILFDLLEKKPKNYRNNMYGGFDFDEVYKILDGVKESCILG